MAFIEKDNYQSEKKNLNIKEEIPEFEKILNTWKMNVYGYGKSSFEFQSKFVYDIQKNKYVSKKMYFVLNETGIFDLSFITINSIKGKSDILYFFRIEDYKFENIKVEE